MMRGRVESCVGDGFSSYVQGMDVHCLYVGRFIGVIEISSIQIDNFCRDNLEKKSIESKDAGDEN